jgi:predicted CopG family antitoxin
VHPKCMAVKTITIDMDAYRTLSRLKRPGQSFSQVIKEKLGHHKTGATLVQTAIQMKISSDALDAMQKVVRDRKKSKLKHPKL